MDRLERSGPQPEGKFDRQQQQIFDLPLGLCQKPGQQIPLLGCQENPFGLAKTLCLQSGTPGDLRRPHKIQRYLLPGSQLVVFGPDRRAWPHGPLQKEASSSEAYLRLSPGGRLSGSPEGGKIMSRPMLRHERRRLQRSLKEKQKKEGLDYPPTFTLPN